MHILQHSLIISLLHISSTIALQSQHKTVTPLKRSTDHASRRAVSNTAHSLELTRKTSISGNQKRRGAASLRATNSTSTTGIVSLFEGEEFATNITFGSQTFSVIIDTGSSDTWLIESGFACVDITTSANLTEADCAFGPTYDITDAFVEIPNEEFSITYGDGEFLKGIVGWEEVEVAGLRVNTTVALVNYAAWAGDAVTSGLMGLAYPALTSAFINDTTQVPYSPIFTSLYNANLTASFFSIAIERNTSGSAGFLTFGGNPPVDFVDDFTTTPILTTSISGYPVKYDFYTIDIDGVTLAGKEYTEGVAGTTQYIVDSGTTLNYLPTEIANRINAAFDPPAIYSETEGAYLVSCTATAPALSITIGSKPFVINPLDMILGSTDTTTGEVTCITGIDDGGNDPTTDLYILGDTFLKNVVARFDVGEGMLGFAARSGYPSNDIY